MNPRDRITQALVNIQNPPPQMQMPLGPMSMPGTPQMGALAGMNATGPASSPLGGMPSQPPMPMTGAGAPPTPGMPPAPGAQPSPATPGVGAPAPQMPQMPQPPQSQGY
jgi:Ca-activated chloride channel family protein